MRFAPIRIGIGFLIITLMMIMSPSHVLQASEEFNAEVRVDNNQVESGRSEIFDNMEERIEEFINNQSWTDLQIQRDERIDCSFSFTITEWNRDEDEFEANLQVQAVRPVYESGYNTTLINHLDEEVEFNFGPAHRLEFAQGSHLSELGSVIAYYLFYTMGLEFDANSEFGGTPYFRMAENVVNSAQASQAPGWSAHQDDRNRHGLVHTLLRDRNREFREAWYIYHRKGLDYMAADPEEGRGNITRALKTLNEFHSSNPNTYIQRMFFRAKSTEIINTYSQATASERDEVLDLLQRMDPRNTSEYRSRLR